MLERLTSFLRGGTFDSSSSGLQAATQLPDPPPPKVANRQQTIPSYLTTAKPGQTPLPAPDRRLATTSTLDLRSGSSTKKVIRDFAAASPDLAAALFAYLRVGIPAGYTAVAKNPDGTFNPDATGTLQQVISRMDVLPDYSQGYAANLSLRSCSEALAKELVLEGACSAELILDKTRLPTRIAPIAVTNILFQPDPKDLTLFPIQRLGGQNIVLDQPTFFYMSLDQDLTTAYASSMFEPALKAVIFSEDFIADIHRVVKRAIHPRINVSINEEAFRKNMPADAAHDETKMAAYRAQVISDIENTINGLKPEDAVVHFDSVEISFDNNGNISLSKEYDTLQNIANAKVSTGSKTMPAILGHGSGSQNVASSESMLFVKNATGAVTLKLNEIYSRIFTLALRLMGLDVIVEFKYDTIDLRPDSELESFRAMKQSRILELLSLGMMGDEQASIELTGQLPPAGYKPLTGTMFMVKAAQPNANPNGDKNGGSALNQDLNGNSPEQTKSPKGSPVKRVA